MIDDFAVSEPAARTATMIRRPLHDVFEAFVDPEIITRFWFTESSGRLESGASITWTWGMYGATGQVDVIAVEQDARVVFTWNGPENPTAVVWTFTSLGNDRTFVDIVNYGFTGSTIEQAIAAIDSTGGFTWVLAGAKAWLEHGIELGLVGDRFPTELRGHE